MTPHSSRKERVCNACFLSNSGLEPVSGGGRDSDVSSERSASVSESDLLVEESVEIPTRRSRKWTMQQEEEESEGGTSKESSTIGSPPVTGNQPGAEDLGPGQ